MLDVRQKIEVNRMIEEAINDHFIMEHLKKIKEKAKPAVKEVAKEKKEKK